MRRLGLFLLSALLLVAGPARGDDEKPSLARALFLEKTAREPERAIPLFEALAADPSSSVADRAQARFGAARCHEAAGRLDAAIAALGAIVDDPSSPPTDRDDARARRATLQRERVAAGDRDAAARAEAELRRAELATQEKERRLAASRALVDAAVVHMKAKRDEDARQTLLEALERNPSDERALALLEEIGGRTDRGNLLKQAIRFVASNRVADLARLTSTVDALRRAGRRSLKEGRGVEAAVAFRDAVARIDDSDFHDELAATRRELTVWFGKALDDAKAKGAVLDEALRVPAAGPRGSGEGGTLRPWRAEFFSLLGRIFASREDGSAPVRFYDAAIPPDTSPEAAGTRFSASGISSTVAAGTLRRARFLERLLRREVAPGGWSGADRLLDRYEDLVIVQNGAGVLKAADALAAAFPSIPAPPLAVEVRVYAAAPGGLEEVSRLLHASAAATDEGVCALVRGLALSEQETLIGSVERVSLLARASLRLTGRRTAVVRFREPTAAARGYADETAPKVVVTDRDATYGLDVELYGEDLVPDGKKDAAISLIARVRRPDRPRLAPLSSGWVRAPVFLEQSVEADRRVPHGASLLVYGLSNPFRATGYAGDPNGGAQPDLLVVVSARPSGDPSTPDVIPAASPTRPSGSPAPPSEITTRELDLGVVGHDVVDEPPPEDWPRTAFGSSRFAPARASRDAFLAGWIADESRVPATEGPVLVHEGRMTASASAVTQGRVAAAVEALVAGADRIVRVEVDSIELTADRAAQLLLDAKVRLDSPAQRVVRLDAAASLALTEGIGARRDRASPYDLVTRVAALHTQLVTARTVRSRAVVEEIRSERRADGTDVLVPVNGTVEEGAVVSVRPVVLGPGLVSLYASAILADLERADEWRPEGLSPSAPAVALPRHRVERAAAVGALAQGETLLLVVPSPGADGARVVWIRIRLPR